MNITQFKYLIAFWLYSTLLGTIQLNAQCGGYEHVWNGVEVPNEFQFIKNYKIDSKGEYQPRVYIYNLDSGEYNIFTTGKNSEAELKIEILTSKKETVADSQGGFGNMQFIIAKKGWYYLVFTSLKHCSGCDCAIAYLSKKQFD